jgi:hypothetical protein
MPLTGAGGRGTAPLLLSVRVLVAHTSSYCFFSLVFLLCDDGEGHPVPSLGRHIARTAVCMDIMSVHARAPHTSATCVLATGARLTRETWVTLSSDCLTAQSPNTSLLSYNVEKLVRCSLLSVYPVELIRGCAKARLWLCWPITVMSPVTFSC